MAMEPTANRGRGSQVAPPVDNIDCDALPVSLQIKLTPGASGSSLHDALIHENGVDDVVVEHVSDIFTQGDLRDLNLDPLRAEAPRHTECTSSAFARSADQRHRARPGRSSLMRKRRGSCWPRPWNVPLQRRGDGVADYPFGVG